ncbi:hypothetical protein SAMN05421747_101403 [Parapedobacter composti]|uniref:N-formylglutamate amidohydrolase n=1 Tax=Parapedobacter composti TaxID=623281 RepID=A0A1I1E9N4_9SPHI|nr:N-formylglutamate amidohydrolase [Parapedobacter composti]SFB83292.1 hypothetical protein SAMN05421747_101403 [Parapedobacter composti]
MKRKLFVYQSIIFSFIVVCSQTLAQTATSAGLAPQHWKAGDIYADEHRWNTCHVGDMPLVISVPHGGRLKPSTLPDRQCLGVKGIDRNTMELAEEIEQAFIRQYNKRPYIVFTHLHRSKIDQNRDFDEATCGNEALRKVWETFHRYIDTCLADAVQKHGYALYIDLHGHAHPNQRLELGYLIGSKSMETLYKSEDGAQAALGHKTSMRSVAINNGMDVRELLFGDNAFGTLLQNAGIAATPSKQDPYPVEGEKFFSGGYNTRRYTSGSHPNVFGFQIECHFKGVRSEEDIPGFAKKFAEVTVAYLNRLRLPKTP